MRLLENHRFHVCTHFGMHFTLFELESHTGTAICIVKPPTVPAVYFSHVDEYSGRLTTFNSVRFGDFCGFHSDTQTTVVFYID